MERLGERLVASKYGRSSREGQHGSCNPMQPGATPCNRMQPISPARKTNPPTPSAEQCVGAPPACRSALLKSDRVGRGDALQPHATPCNASQPGATETADRQNEP